jgi:hypothetical protein
MLSSLGRVAVALWTHMPGGSEGPDTNRVLRCDGVTRSGDGIIGRQMGPVSPARCPRRLPRGGAGLAAVVNSLRTASRTPFRRCGRWRRLRDPGRLSRPRTGPHR